MKSKHSLEYIWKQSNSTSVLEDSLTPISFSLISFTSAMFNAINVWKQQTVLHYMF